GCTASTARSPGRTACGGLDGASPEPSSTGTSEAPRIPSPRGLRCWSWSPSAARPRRRHAAGRRGAVGDVSARCDSGPDGRRRVMTAVIAESPRIAWEEAPAPGPAPFAVLAGAPAPQDEDRDGIEVYCPRAEAWSRTRDLFC